MIQGPSPVSLGDSIAQIYRSATDPGWPQSFLGVVRAVFDVPAAVVANERSAGERIRIEATEESLAISDLRPLFREARHALDGQTERNSGQHHIRSDRLGSATRLEHIFTSDGRGSITSAAISQFPDGGSPLVWVKLRDHVVRAAAARFRVDDLERRHRLADRVLNSLNLATFIVGLRGEVVYLNVAGRAVLDDAKYLDVRSGRLEPSDPKSRRDFVSLLRRSCESDCLGAILLSPASFGADRALLAARSLDRVGGEPVVLIYMTRPFADLAGLEPILRQAFGLTRMESRTAITAMKGGKLTEVSQELGVGLETTRAHMRGVLAKTGARRQIQLFSKVLGAGVFSLFSSDDAERTG